MSDRADLSFVIPLTTQERNFARFLVKLNEILKRHGCTCEVIFVDESPGIGDDGSGARNRIMEKISISWLFEATFLRFLLVRLTNFVISYSAFRLCLKMLHEVLGRGLLSQLASYSCGICWSFFRNQKITFRNRGPVLSQSWCFVTLQASLAVSSALLIGFGVDIAGFNPPITWLVVMPVVTAVNLILSRWWVFRWRENLR